MPARSLTPVDRAAWLAERGQYVVDDYDEGAATYDDIDYPREVQEVWVGRLVATCPSGGSVLDAACGTGRYFPVTVAAGRRVVGVDQSSGMLAQARARGLAEALHHVGLRDLAFDAAFDGAICVDALENVPPEDWPAVVANLARAVRPGSHLYLTVEETDDAQLDAALTALLSAGAPAVRGEVVEGDVAGYHFYPGRDRVGQWLRDAGLDVVDEAVDPHDGWAYRHLLLRRA